MYYSTVIASAFLASLVAGHGAIIGATGDAGGQGSAIGVDPATPRDGTRRNPFQQDSTRFQGAQADACGETLGGGDNDLETGTAAMMANMNTDQLPQVTQGGEVQMTLHQVNGDGAGPYTCMIDSTGTGTQWENIQVTTQAPGRNGRNRDTAEADVPLTAAIPANQQCTGSVAGQDNVCVVRCQNPARAGPFGGCVPVQMVQAGAAAGNATEAAGAADAAAAKSKRTLSRRTRIMGRSNIAPEDDIIDAAFAAELIADGEEVI